MSVQRSMRNIQHFIWDFDGTLFDTYPVIIGDLRKALGKAEDVAKQMGDAFVSVEHLACCH